MHNYQSRAWLKWLSLRHVATLLVLFIAFAYSAWLIKVTSPKTQEERYSDKIPDYYLTDVVALEFNEQGQLLHQLLSPKVIHIPSDDTVLLKAPHITVYSTDVPPQAPWQITALHGKTIENNKYAWLWNQVVLHQPSSAQNKEMTILTSRMRVVPSENIADTHAPVTVIQPGLEVHSIGMRAFLKEKRVDLLSRAQGVYDVNAAGDN